MTDYRPTMDEALRDCLDWLDNIERGIGKEKLVDYMPNDIQSRDTMRGMAERKIAKRAKRQTGSKSPALHEVGPVRNNEP